MFKHAVLVSIFSSQYVEYLHSSYQLPIFVVIFNHSSFTCKLLTQYFSTTYLLYVSNITTIYIHICPLIWCSLHTFTDFQHCQQKLSTSTVQYACIYSIFSPCAFVYGHIGVYTNVFLIMPNESL